MSVKSIGTLILLLGVFHLAASAADVRTVGVFVALCDNEHQGIVPVPKAIGNGDDPDRNLYWGSAEGFLGVFGKSPYWKKESVVDTPSNDVMRTCTCLHASGKMSLKAFAYRGSAIKACIEDFEQALCQGKYDLVAYIGHNGLMDFSLPLPRAVLHGRSGPSYGISHRCRNRPCRYCSDSGHCRQVNLISAKGQGKPMVDGYDGKRPNRFPMMVSLQAWKDR